MSEHVPIELDSHDGNLHLSMPVSGVVTTTLVSVTPIRGTKPITNDVSSDPDETTLELSLPNTLTLVGTLYNVRASGEITRTTQPGRLTLYSDRTDVDQKIYHWDQRTGQWDSLKPENIDLSGSATNGDFAISTDEFEEFGIYGILINTHYLYLPIVANE